MDLPIEVLYKIDAANLIAMAAMIYFSHSRLNHKIDKLEEKLSDKINQVDKKLSDKIDQVDKKLSDKIDKTEEKLSNKIDKLDEKMTDVDRRLCRLEGAFASKDCCMIKDERQMKKVE